ncbi:U2 snRNP-associated SURP domain-containing protein [Bonamia ostreae]|uniref:U2 snRNP-associated SURP domain-containing protein n=2 Tax=Bonamia ostreae TaxID=126728 RepID=A0ABV2AGQ1_9EUKA
MDLMSHLFVNYGRNAISRKKEQKNQNFLRIEKSFEQSDPQTKNVLISNLPDDLSEQELAIEMSKFGPVGTVRIFVESINGKTINNAFVNFMWRDDARNAINALNDQILFDKIVTLSMEKVLPPVWYPIQFGKKEATVVDIDQLKNVEMRTVEMIKDDKTRRLIDAVATFVSKEGYLFEKHFIEIHAEDPNFDFITETKTPKNLYYRWRVYSLSQGDSLDDWSLKPFRIIENGPLWIPPSKNRQNTSSNTKSTQKPITKFERKKSITKFMKENKRDELDQILSNLDKDRYSIREAMGFCIDNSEHAIEIADTITESLIVEETDVNKRISRLYLVSDILHNSDSSVRNSSAYRSEFQRNLEEIFAGLHSGYSKIDGRITAEKMKEDVLTVLNVWQAWSLFPVTLLNSLEATFLSVPKEETVLGVNKEENEDIDGVPLEEDIDGFQI